MDIPFIIGLIVVALAMIYATVLVLFHNENKKPQNKVHFYVTRNRSNNELCLWLGKPFKGTQNWIECYKTTLLATSENFYEYDLKVEDFDYLLWAHEPVEVFLNLDN